MNANILSPRKSSYLVVLWGLVFGLCSWDSWKKEFFENLHLCFEIFGDREAIILTKKSWKCEEFSIMGSREIIAWSFHLGVEWVLVVGNHFLSKILQRGKFPRNRLSTGIPELCLDRTSDHGVVHDCTFGGGTKGTAGRPAEPPSFPKTEAKKCEEALFAQFILAAQGPCRLRGCGPRFLMLAVVLANAPRNPLIIKRGKTWHWYQLITVEVVSCLAQ